MVKGTVKCVATKFSDQACSQIGTPGGAKSFLRGSQIFELCPTHFSHGAKKN